MEALRLAEQGGLSETFLQSRDAFQLGDVRPARRQFTCREVF